jgi:hypothetical protein
VVSSGNSILVFFLMPCLFSLPSANTCLRLPQWMMWRVSSMQPWAGTQVQVPQSSRSCVRKRRRGGPLLQMHRAMRRSDAQVVSSQSLRPSSGGNTGSNMGHHLRDTKDVEGGITMLVEVSCTCKDSTYRFNRLLGTELSLSSRGSMTLGVRKIF